MCLYRLIYISYQLSTTFFHCHLVFCFFFYCKESKQTLLLISNVHISCIYHPNMKTCTTQLFVNWGILPVLAYKPLEWKSQVMFWRICCSTLWSVLWPHHTITDFEIAPPWLFQWQWSELCWCTYARFSCDRWSGLLICDDMLRDLLQGNMKSHFANSFGQLFDSCYLAVLGLGKNLQITKVQMPVKKKPPKHLLVESLHITSNCHLPHSNWLPLQTVFLFFWPVSLQSTAQPGVRRLFMRKCLKPSHLAVKSQEVDLDVTCEHLRKR